MPFYRKPHNFTPLSLAAEKKAVKNGLHHKIFTSGLDFYKGEWKSDLKDATSLVTRSAGQTLGSSPLRSYRSTQQNNGVASNNIALDRKGYFYTITGKLYEGDWYKGFRHGFGTLSHRLQNGTFRLDYRGDWIRGKPDGIGTWYYENGDVYFGYWKRGYRHGYGKMWYANGTMYVGYWNRGEKEGLGMFVQENGNRYEGHWEHDIKNGIGRFYHLHTGQLQEGCWVNNVCVKSKMSDIIIRQFCDEPTPYPIPPEQLADPKKVLEESRLWLKMKMGDIDKKLRYCIDQMW